MKQHTTVKITEALLRELEACERGIEQARPFLPATLSTDPEKNLDLACTLACDVFVNTWWLYSTVVVFCPDCPDGHDYQGDTECDPYIRAQWLAMIADTLATKAGR